MARGPCCSSVNSSSQVSANAGLSSQQEAPTAVSWALLVRGRQQVGLVANLAVQGSFAVPISAPGMERFPGEVWQSHLRFPEALKFADF